MISDRLWDRAFQRDPNIVGRAINFHGQPFTVTGVMPPRDGCAARIDAWFSVMRRSANPGWQNRANHPAFFGWGRLKEGVTVEQARTEIKTIAARLEKLYPATNTGFSANVKPLLENLLGSYQTNLTLLLCAVALVLLIACANLANLFAARGATRAREFAIRAAIGASRAPRYPAAAHRRFLRRRARRSLWLSLRRLGTRRARRLRSGQCAAL